MTVDSTTKTSRYQKTISEVLGELIPVGSDVALFDFPNYSNVGDSMIWLGQRKFLRDVAKARVRAVKDFSVGTPRFPKLDPTVIILLQGGGNTGDLWPQFQEIREQAVKQYPNNRVIQMPQSIHFEDERGFERVEKIYGTHSDFHFLARDSKSLSLARRLTGRDEILCPDMALFLDPIPRIDLPSRDIVALLREDKEKNLISRKDECTSGLHVIDWLQEDSSLAIRMSWRIRNLQNRLAADSEILFAIKGRLYDTIAKQRLKRGVRLLGDGKVVITDRLHAHILCCLMGIPNVVIDNSYGKIFALLDTWETGREFTERANTFEEAKQKAHRMLTELR